MDADDHSVDAARRAAEDGRLDDWVSAFLSSPGSDNAALADQLRERVRSWIGPVRLPLDRLHRLAGPEGDPVLCPVDDDDWHPRVDDLARKVVDGFEPPPLVVTLQGTQLVLDDGNHRVEGLRRAGDADAWAVVGLTDPDTDPDRALADALR